MCLKLNVRDRRRVRLKVRVRHILISEVVYGVPPGGMSCDGKFTIIIKKDYILLSILVIY